MLLGILVVPLDLPIIIIILPNYYNAALSIYIWCSRFMSSFFLSFFLSCFLFFFFSLVFRRYITSSLFFSFFLTLYLRGLPQCKLISLTLTVSLWSCENKMLFSAEKLLLTSKTLNVF